MKTFSALLVAVFSTAMAMAQVPAIEILDRISQQLMQHTNERPLAFIQNDKEVYQAGTAIWYKVFLVNRTSLTPHLKAGIVYAELRNDQDSLITQQMLSTANNEMEGRFLLPENIKEGNYYIQAFLPSMLKEEPSGIKRNSVYIVQSKQSISTPARPILYRNNLYKPANGILFYPEGQHLIQGIDNRITVTSFNENGEPVPGNGRITDNRDSVITRFEIGLDGISSFTINPQKLQQYKCLFTTTSGTLSEKKLPAPPLRAYQAGILSETSDILQFRIGLSDLLYTEKPSSYFIGFAKGKVVFAAAGKGMYAVSVNKKELPYGPVDFYLFDEKENLVSQRTVWNDHTGVQSLFTTDKSNYISRAPVSATLQLTDHAGKPVRGLVAISITDSSTVPGPLMQEVLRYWEKEYPEVSFFAAHKPAATQGYLQQILILHTKGTDTNKVDSLTTENDNNGIIISGALRDEKNNPVTNQAITLVSQQGNIILLDTTRENGHFSMMPTQIYEGIGFIPSINKGNNLPAGWHIELDPVQKIHANNFRSVTALPLPADTWNQHIERFRKLHSDSIQYAAALNWVQLSAEGAATGPGKKTAKRGGFTRTITREQLSKLELSNTANAVMMIPGVIMQGGKLTIRGGTPSLDASLPANIEPMVILDDVPVRLAAGTLVDFLNSIPPDNIDYIEVFMDGDAALFATRALNGVIRIKTGLPTNKNRSGTGASVIYPGGFHAAPEFKTADHSNEKIREAAFRDNRATIYWNGHILSDENGRVTFRFYTADASTTYRVLVTGISSKGEPIRETFWIKRNF